MSKLDKNNIKEKAESCVRCGYCLPHCPTFQLTKDERYSPRGRIIMMKAYGQDNLELKSADEYLSSCLNCLNCESVCPADVDYQSLISSFAKEKNKNFADKKQKFLIWFLTHSITNRIFFICARFCKFFGFHYFSKFLKPSVLKTYLSSINLVHFVKPKRIKSKPFYQKKTTEKRKIILFSGCSSEFEQKLLDKVYFLTTFLGLDVEFLKSPSCCGSLSYHSGDENRAEKLAKNLNNQFNQNSLILVFSSGCLSYLQSEPFKKFSQNQEINYQDGLSFLLNEIEKKEIKFANWKSGKVLLHLPCTQRYPLGQNQIIKLLGKIQGLNPKIIDWGCCGSAGSFLFSRPKESMDLAKLLLTQTQEKLNVRVDEFDYIVTSNIGCKLQFNQAINSKIRIVHPIELIADLII